ncbi:hypothetical protein L7F22_031887, partial [Adiantum nelumboides]|nr:hypothetical protein [Adiantum nelumboides]
GPLPSGESSTLFVGGRRAWRQVGASDGRYGSELVQEMPIMMLGSPANFRLSRANMCEGVARQRCNMLKKSSKSPFRMLVEDGVVWSDVSSSCGSVKTGSYWLGFVGTQGLCRVFISSTRLGLEQGNLYYSCMDWDSGCTVAECTRLMAS